MTLHGGSLVERELDRPVCVVLITEKRGECARPQIPFTRASSAGLAGKRAVACLRLAEPSSAAPRQTEQRSEPVGPRSRVPRGIAKGGWASSPPWLAGEGERPVGRQRNVEQRCGVGGSPGTACRAPTNGRREGAVSPAQRRKYALKSTSLADKIACTRLCTFNLRRIADTCAFTVVSAMSRW